MYDIQFSQYWDNSDLAPLLHSLVKAVIDRRMSSAEGKSTDFIAIQTDETTDIYTVHILIIIWDVYIYF